MAANEREWPDFVFIYGFDAGIIEVGAPLDYCAIFKDPEV